ncbi:putative ATP-dependent RNA helicase DHX34-like protein [Haematococcus lacustris]
MVVEEYRACLPWWEDFVQRRQLAKLCKLVADRATLPMAAYEQAIVQAVREHQAVVIAGDTGCGKSTQVPQFLVAAGFKRVVCTQPRRISAISLARRVSYETLNVHGDEIAYKIRFASTMSGGSKVVFLTEGILLRMMSSDPLLAAVDVVIVDEVHERHLNTDFLLALLRALLLQRPELRVVLMSATINFQAYADYFGGAPVIQVPGRLYPIELEYCPPAQPKPENAGQPQAGKRGAGCGPSSTRQGKGGGSGKGGAGRAGAGEADAIDPTPYLRLLQRIDSEVPSSQRGDLLIFVAGLADITALTAALRTYALEGRRWVVLPLHSSLSVEDQDKVFDAAPEGVRKAIISTNIAETSVTIDGVRFVADSGRAKEMVHDVTSGSASLQEGWISKASADQRKGRAGRTGPGKCFRMYERAQYEAFRAFSLPEIQRVRLESVVLQIKALAGDGLDPRAFGFIDPPPADCMESAIINLKQVGALTLTESLTPLGALLSLLPVDPHVGKLLVLGAVLRLSDPCLTIAAALSVQSPFARLADDNDAAKAARYELLSPHGDALTLLEVFEHWLHLKQGRHKGASTKWCKRAGLEEQRLYEMAKLKGQFKELLSDVGLERMALRERPGDLLPPGDRPPAATDDPGSPDESKPRKRSRHHLSGGQLHEARSRLRRLQAQRDRERGRKVLQLEEEESKEEEEEEEVEEGKEEGGGEGKGRSAAAAGRSGKEEKEDLHDLELRLAVDVAAMAAAAARPLSPGDVSLLKWVVAAALYPRFAVPDPANKQRKETECRFHTISLTDLAVHPSSSLTGNLTALSAQEVVVYVEVLETRRQYLCNLTPCWALAPLLLNATMLDTDRTGSRWVVDSWLLLRLHDGSGPMLMELVCRLRRQTSLLLRRRLAAARLPGLGNMSSELCSPAAPDLLPGGAAAVATIGPCGAEQASADLKGVRGLGGGLRLAPWLRWGSLRGGGEAAAAHALAPALRRPWTCPSCAVRLVGTHTDITAHLHSCAPAAQDVQALLEAGYTPSSHALHHQHGAGPAAGSRVGGEGGAATQEAQAALVEAAGQGGERLREYVEQQVVWARRV